MDTDTNMDMVMDTDKDMDKDMSRITKSKNNRHWKQGSAFSY